MAEDGDAVGDACDCDPLDPLAGHPRETSGVRAEVLGNGSTRFGWSASTVVDRYDIMRGDISDPAGALCWTADDPDATDTEYFESAIPAPGAGWFYLFRGVDDACGGPGSWGSQAVTNDCP